jgi:hypothetical protein
MTSPNILREYQAGFELIAKCLAGMIENTRDKDALESIHKASREAWRSVVAASHDISYLAYQMEKFIEQDGEGPSAA